MPTAALIWRRLFRQPVMRAASRARDSAGSRRPMRNVMIEMTTSSSMSVNAGRRRG